MIGVDIGGTNLLIGKIEGSTVTQRMHEPIIKRGDFHAVARQVSDAILSFTSQELDTVGIAVAGGVDAENGIVLRAQNLDWNNVPLAEVVAEQLQCKVVIENDVTAAAWGEFKFGVAKNVDSMFAVWIGTGIGGGLILDGTIWRGPLGTGGEFGMSISEHTPSIQDRALESFASRSGLQRITGIADLDTEAITIAYNNDKDITLAVNEGAKRIGTSIANVITLLALDTVVLGGGLIESLGNPYIQQIREQFDIDVFPHHCRACVFTQTALGPDAGLLGAADIAAHS
jgi:glucokinase